jgi:large subunit ribosomal protein L30
MTVKQIKVTLVKSKHGRKPGHKACVHGLGLKKIRQAVIVQDTPCNRGMVNKAAYLFSVEEL